MPAIIMVLITFSLTLPAYWRRLTKPETAVFQSWLALVFEVESSVVKANGWPETDRADG